MTLKPKFYILMLPYTLICKFEKNKNKKAGKCQGAKTVARGTGGRCHREQRRHSSLCFEGFVPRASNVP